MNEPAQRQMSEPDARFYIAEVRACAHVCVCVRVCVHACPRVRGRVSE